VQALDLLTTEAGLKREVEAFERLYGRQAAGAHGRLQAAGVPELDLGSEQALDRLAAGDRPAVDPREDGIERFQRAGHLEIGQHAPDPVPARGLGLHTAPPARAA